MRLEVKWDRSIYYWISDLVADNINVEDGFPGGKLDLPTVSVTNLDVRGEPLELGGCEQNEIMWRIDIFAKNKTQRDELAYLLYSELEAHIDVNDYDVGFPPDTTPPKIGVLLVDKRVLKPVRVFEDLVEKLYWRSSITFRTKYQAI
jgi:hypothetical protein